MTRTVFPVHPLARDKPEFNNPSFLRGCAEEAHYESLSRHFLRPLCIGPVSHTDATRLLQFRDIFHKRQARRLDQLTPDDCRLFCWKDCAIYGASRLPREDHLRLLDAVYREWFPHRAEDKDVSDGSFFAKFMRFEGGAGGGTTQETLHFHKALCERLSVLEREMPETMPVDPCRAFAHLVQPEAVEYKLRKTFSVVFLMLDVGWQDRGVLLVWRSKEDALRHHCGEGGEIMELDHNNGVDPDQACVFRCSLKRAMQLIVSTDRERAKRRREYNEYLEETLGEDDVDNLIPSSWHR